VALPCASDFADVSAETGHQWRVAAGIAPGEAIDDRRLCYALASAGIAGRYQVSTTTQVEVFLGEPIAHDTERVFLARLRADLSRRGCRARIYANFITRSSQRQVDFLVGTEHRLVNVELKTVDQSLPLIGGINGPWTQELPGGKRRSFERNFYRQAHEATFAISDDMHELARLGEVPRVSGK
jgi:hypothetical protein